MPKRPSKKMFEWWITRIRSTPAALIGYVEAPDAEQAIKEAIRAFGVTDPEQQKRLAAVPVKAIKRPWLFVRDLFSSCASSCCSRSSKSRWAATGWSLLRTTWPLLGCVRYSRGAVAAGGYWASAESAGDRE
jgi:hypothetical protein